MSKQFKREDFLAARAASTGTMINDATLEVFRNSLRAHASDMPLNDAEKNALQTAFDHHTATLRQQAGRVDEGEGFDPRKFVRNLTDVLEAGGGMFKIDADLARLGAAIQAALAQNTQGDGEPVAWQMLGENGQWVNISAAEYWTLRNANVGQQRGLYTHAVRARVPEGKVLIDREALEIIANSLPLKHDTMPYAMEALGFARNEARDALAAAPSQPKDAGEVES